jgi:hypothetical protein
MPFIPPALLNFISGLAAGAGINLLTSLSGLSPSARTTTVVDSVAWLIAAVFLAATAQIVEGVERDAALAIDNTLTKAERHDILHDEMAEVATRYRIALGLSAVSLVSSMVLVPGLVV